MPLTDEDLSKAAGIEGPITDCCVSQNREGGDLIAPDGAVADFIAQYTGHKDTDVQLTPLAPEVPTKKFARTLATQLGADGCSRDQADEIERAISGRSVLAHSPQPVPYLV